MGQATEVSRIGDGAMPGSVGRERGHGPWAPVQRNFNDSREVKHWRYAWRTLRWSEGWPEPKAKLSISIARCLILRHRFADAGEAPKLKCGRRYKTAPTWMGCNVNVSKS